MNGRLFIVDDVRVYAYLRVSLRQATEQADAPLWRDDLNTQRDSRLGRSRDDHHVRASAIGFAFNDFLQLLVRRINVDISVDSFRQRES